MMKAFAIFPFLFLISFGLFAQVSISAEGDVPNSSAMLDVKSTTRGFLPPRMTEAQRDAISDPEPGLQVFNSTTRRPNYFNGSVWVHFDGSPAEPLEIGDYFQGGIVFYLDGSGGGLVCALNDLDADLGGVSWTNGGSYTETNASGTAIGTGKSNTDAIIASLGLPGQYAAEAADSLNFGGYTDWFLPAKDELNEIYIHLSTVNASMTAFGGTPLNFTYWSSTEVDQFDAWAQNFSQGGSQFSQDKTWFYNGRAIRSF